MPDAMPAPCDIHWSSADGLRLHARDYQGGGPADPPLLCLPGLTRNARDFAPFVERHARGRRVIAVDYRGRGDSDRAEDPMTYVPLTYVADVLLLLAREGIGRVVAVGTSLGGIVAMLLAAARPGLVTAALLNDVGPVIEPAGLARIRGYVGRASSLPTWMHAARCLAEANGDVYPDWGTDDWLALAKRLYRVSGSGRIVLDYDLRIAEPLRLPEGGAVPDLWPAFDALGEAPVLVVRGERSDVLSAATAAAMAKRAAHGALAIVPRVGHAPLLTEPVLDAPIAAWLARAEEPGGA